MEISKGCICKIYPQSGLLVNRDGGVIGLGYREIVKVIMTNHGKVPYETFVGQRIAHIIFHKVEQVTFVKANTLSKTERQCGGFGSTGY